MPNKLNKCHIAALLLRTMHTITECVLIQNAWNPENCQLIQFYWYLWLHVGYQKPFHVTHVALVGACFHTPVVLAMCGHTHLSNFIQNGHPFVDLRFVMVKMFFSGSCWPTP